MAKAVRVPHDVEVNDEVRITLYQHHYEIPVAEGQEDADHYEHARRGQCMLCGNDLGEDTVVLVGPGGIIGIWDEGECLTDQTVIGWLSEVLEEMTMKYIQQEEE